MLVPWLLIKHPPGNAVIDGGASFARSPRKARAVVVTGHDPALGGLPACTGELL
jgi:hypothetical protein